MVMVRRDDNKAVAKSTQVSVTFCTASTNVGSSLLGWWCVVMMRRDDNKAETKSMQVSATFGIASTNVTIKSETELTASVLKKDSKRTRDIIIAIRALAVSD